jgi:hypothetical protein
MFRFTIRDVLWLMVVVALSAAWWIDHTRTRRALAELHVHYAANGWREAERLETEVATLRSQFEVYERTAPGNSKENP